jgi:phage terminase large subunit-like protein
MTVLDANTLQRWKNDPITFVSEVLHDPETSKPFVLLPAEIAFMTRAFMLGDDGRLLYPELVYGAPKKSGKTTLAAIVVLVMVLLRNDALYAEGLCAANDYDQAASRVFMMIKRIVTVSPLLKNEAKVTADKIVFPNFDATITAIASDASSAAGSSPTISCFDELWGYTSERATRLWDELITSPTKKISCRLTVSYAGFSGESVLLEDLHKRGMALPEIGPSLHAGDGMLFAWHTSPIAPWQTPQWLEEMRRSLRPSAFARMILNQFVSPESKFIPMSEWDACVQPSLTPVLRDRGLPIWVGVDASTKRDSTALVAVTFDRKSKSVKLICHRVFVPTPGDPIDFEATVERTLREWQKNFALQQVLFDPFQLASVMQRLTRERMPVEEYAQTVPALTATTSNLFDLISARQLMLYPDAGMRTAISHAIITESARGWKLDKLKQAQKIDVIVALSMAALAAVRADGKMKYDLSRWFPDESTTSRDLNRQAQLELNRFISTGGGR